MTRHSVDWGLGGVSDESGHLQRPVEPVLLVVPGIVEIRGEKLVWKHERKVRKRLMVASTYAERKQLMDRLGPNFVVEGNRNELVLIQEVKTDPSRVVLPGPKLLEDFIQLADKGDEAIRAYAGRWGILGICKHYTIRTHKFLSYPTGNIQSPELGLCKLLGYRAENDSNPAMGWEPLGTWRHYAREAKAILDIAAHLHQGKPLEDEKVWSDAGLPGTHMWGYDGQPDSELCANQALQISIPINVWLELGSVRPSLSWGDGSPPTVTLGTTVDWFHRKAQKTLLPRMPTLQGTALFGELAVQLLMAASRTRGLAICSACGKPYSPRRRPNAGRRRYCESCGLKAAWRDAQATRRAKQTKHPKAKMR